MSSLRSVYNCSASPGDPHRYANTSNRPQRCAKKASASKAKHHCYRVASNEVCACERRGASPWPHGKERPSRLQRQSQPHGPTALQREPPAPPRPPKARPGRGPLIPTKV